MASVFSTLLRMNRALPVRHSLDDGGAKVGLVPLTLARFR